MQIRIPDFLYALILCSTNPVEAQDMDAKPQWKNEIGATLISLESNYYDNFGTEYYITVMTGISYSRHFGPHAVRAGMDYGDSWHRGYGDFVGSKKYREGKFNLGYQCQLSHRAIKPYVAADLIYLIGKSESEFEGGYAGLYSKVDLVRQGIGFAPALGLKCPLIKSLSISIETNMEFLWITERGTITRSDSYYNSPRTTEARDLDDKVSHWNPLSFVMLNYGF